VMCFGTSSPVASTGISSYLSKLIPEFAPAKSSASSLSSGAVSLDQSSDGPPLDLELDGGADNRESWEDPEKFPRDS
jgi:hypothetical protein